MDKNRTVITIKSVRISILLGLLVLAAVLPAAGQSMIPDDFDWSIYIQDSEKAWYGDGWGSTPPEGYYDPQPFTYNWYGETYTVEPWQEEPAPQQNTGTGYGSSDYVPVPVYEQQYYDLNNTSWNNNEYNSDQWFYQTLDDYFDDLEDWYGTFNTPNSAYISGFTGYAQSYNLDCEARSAVDLAAYFGVNIAHSEFLNRLPKSDDPNEGFVGSYLDSRGAIPPASYGVYEQPVAQLLREYGLNAFGAYGYSEGALKAQIAAGHPVMVWVVGNTELGHSVPYTPASTQRTTYVVPFQHTVVVIGYDANGVTVQDGGMKYTRDWNTFLLSWGVLGDRAVYVK